jgi:hypothetical protein
LKQAQRRIQQQQQQYEHEHDQQEQQQQQQQQQQQIVIEEKKLHHQHHSHHQPASLPTEIIVFFLSDSLKLKQQILHGASKLSDAIHSTLRKRHFCAYSQTIPIRILVSSTIPIHFDVHETLRGADTSNTSAREVILRKQSEAYLTTVGEWWLLTQCKLTLIEVCAFVCIGGIL